MSRRLQVILQHLYDSFGSKLNRLPHIRIIVPACRRRVVSFVVPIPAQIPVQSDFTVQKSPP
jgi:hypothetical protein